MILITPKTGNNRKSSYPIKFKQKFLGMILFRICVLVVSFACSERDILAGTAYNRFLGKISKSQNLYLSIIERDSTFNFKWVKYKSSQVHWRESRATVLRPLAENDLVCF